MRDGFTYSVIIPVNHGKRFLKRVLSSVTQLNFPQDHFEVIVTGNEHDENSKRAVNRALDTFSGSMAYVGTSSSNRSRQLNATCAIAKGRILAFTDDDCIVPRDWLKNLDRVFSRESNIGLVGGPDRSDSESSTLSMALDCVFRSFVGTGGLRKGTGPRVGKYYPKHWNMAVLRDVAMQVAIKEGCDAPAVFDESLTVHGDVDLADRVESIGENIIFAPEIIVEHSRETTLWSFLRNNFKMARVCRVLGVQRLPHPALAVSTLSACILLLASWFVSAARIAVLSGGFLYGFILLTGAILGFRRTGSMLAACIIPLLLLILHVSRGIGYLFPMKRDSSEVR